MGPAGNNTTATAAATNSGANVMYRSVPPRPLSYTFSDEVLHVSIEPRGSSTAGSKRARSKTAPVTINAAEEYAERFRARPTTRPSVIDFNGCGVRMYTGTVGCRRPSKQHPGQFPAVKTRNVSAVPIRSKSPMPKLPMTERGTATTSSLHLAPLAKGAEPNAALSLHTKPYRPPPPLPVHVQTPKTAKAPDSSRPQAGRSAHSSLKSRGKSSGGRTEMGTSNTGSLRQTLTRGYEGGPWEDSTSGKLSTLDAMAFTVSPLAADQLSFPDVLSHSDEFNDLSELPRPKRILPRRDLPWVFRFKVKKEMNALSKIMASKPNSGNSVTPTGSIL